MNEISKRDWKLYRERLPEWQENYMEKLIHEYTTLLNGKKLASDKFWALEKRIRRDKKHPGVCCEVSRSTMIETLLIYLADHVITEADLADFSDDVQQTVHFILERR